MAETLGSDRIIFYVELAVIAVNVNWTCISSSWISTRRALTCQESSEQCSHACVESNADPRLSSERRDTQFPTSYPTLFLSHLNGAPWSMHPNLWKYPKHTSAALQSTLVI